MPSRKEDDIMAEALLKGGKMLEKSCRICGCPLFEVKGKTLCVVCAEDDKDTGGAAPAAEKAAGTPVQATAHVHGDTCGCHAEASAEGVMLADELAETILSLCERVQNEKDPENVLTLMNAVKAGTEALGILCKLE